MSSVLDHPLIVFAISFLTMWVSAYVAWRIPQKFSLHEQVRDDFGVILAGSLTLLGLIIGFSFSMATGRYDQRKNYEEAEANAIGTEYLRADFLPGPDAAMVRTLLKEYLDARIQYYEAASERDLEQVNKHTSELQDRLWSTVARDAEAKPTQIVALTVSGMNDVLNSQGYTQAAWWYKIPRAAWGLMFVIAIGCNVLLGYGARRTPTEGRLLLILPLGIAIAFALIADIDSPRGGHIRIVPQNLTSLADSLRSH